MWKFSCVTILTIFGLAVIQVDSASILAVFPYAGKSHFHVFQPILQELAKRGHEVTVITHYPQKTPLKGYTDISVAAKESFSENVVDLEGVLTAGTWSMIQAVASLGKETCDNLNHPNFDKFLKTKGLKKKYDLMLIEFFVTDCFLALAHHLDIPFIGITSHILMPWSNTRIASIDNPSFVPNHFIGYSDKMTYRERIVNTILYFGSKLVEHYIVDEPGNEAAKAKFGQDLPHLDDIAKNVSLMLTYTHFSITRPRPLVPSMIEIGGLHLHNTQLKPLPKNIEKWINESKDGVIYFSMGSMIKGHTFPEEKRKIFLKAFGRLKQRVLWKWENETMPDKPDNVMIQKWMPQYDILCHPNVKAFIAHGGLLGTTEAVHCGVPVVVMPQFGDQHTNARALEAGGGGVVLNFREADEEMVYNALKTVLDPEFNKKAKELSARFRDRPMSPMDTAIYWIEYVARHKGAHHMRTAAVGMPLYQYLLLDVFGFLAVCTLSILFIGIYVTKLFFRLVMSMFSKSDKKQKKLKKN
ncbi:UDP-glycosyltransferase UGT5-like isoform X4 [Atheta coriaria]|uniref:UDP-glycosyltransferase UGT5-like isoform X4 n=1 Tax=Dalotia coriaria TaxID=877792 RepID=UPI0031F357C8